MAHASACINAYMQGVSTHQHMHTIMKHIKQLIHTKTERTNNNNNTDKEHATTKEHQTHKTIKDYKTNTTKTTTVRHIHHKMTTTRTK